MGAYASVAQLDRASDSDSEGRGFESRQMHQKKRAGQAQTDLHVFIIIPSYQNGVCIALVSRSEHHSQAVEVPWG